MFDDKDSHSKDHLNKQANGNSDKSIGKRSQINEVLNIAK